MISTIAASEFSLVLLLTVLIVVPIAAVAFARSGKGLDELGKGRFSIDRDDDLGSGMTAADSPAAAERERADEVRQMLEAADFRSRARGEGRVDVERQIERLLAGEGASEDRGTDGATTGDDGESEVPAEGAIAGTEDDRSGSGSADPAAGSEIRAEVRQLVVANNERRERRGEPPLDVESEVERRVKEWE